MRLSTAIVLSLLSSCALAAPVNWSLQNVVFSDGGTAHGYFVYDAQTNIFSDAYIYTTAGSVRNGDIYSVSDGADAYGADIQLVILPESPPADPTNFASLVFIFDSPIAGTSGTVGIVDGSGEGTCTDALCNSFLDVRLFTSGQVSVVPIPAAAWLFGSALAGLGWMRRMQPA